jgi:hypothetical protein
VVTILALGQLNHVGLDLGRSKCRMMRIQCDDGHQISRGLITEGMFRLERSTHVHCKWYSDVGVHWCRQDVRAERERLLP